jgi:hypothetical protein
MAASRKSPPRSGRANLRWLMADSNCPSQVTTRLTVA